MHLVLWVFVIGVLNVCLGYALGVYFGYGPPTLDDAWRAFRSRRPADGFADLHIGATERVMRELERQVESLQEASLPTEQEEPPEPELPPLEALRRMVAKATPHLEDLIKRLRRTTGGQGRTAWSFVAELQEICEPYLGGLGHVADRLFDDPEQLEEGGPIGEELEQVVLNQLAQLETTANNLQHMDFSAGFSTAKTRLLAETEKVLAFAERLGKALEADSRSAEGPDTGPHPEPDTVPNPRSEAQPSPRADTEPALA